MARFPAPLLWASFTAAYFAQMFCAEAEPVVFTVDPTQSSITLSGTVLGSPLQEQGPGSLTTSFSGSITADLSASTVIFINTGLLIAQTNGEWEPKAKGVAGKEPANYGAMATALGTDAKAAARNIQFQLTSGPLPITAGSFDSAGIVFQFPPNAPSTLDYSAGFFAGKKTLSGLGTNYTATKATLITSGDLQTLTIPVEVDFFVKLITPNDVKLTVKNQLVATRTIGGSAPTFENWLTQKFAGQSDPNVVGATADPDADGLPNFVEYAFGLEPNVRNENFAPLIAKIDPAAATVLTLEYSRPKGLSGISYSIEVSDNLVTWTALSASPEITDQGDGQEKVVLRDTQTISSQNQTGRFLRLSVVKN